MNLISIISWTLFVCALETIAQSNFTNSTNSSATNCNSPTGFANTVVFAPDALATTNHKIADSFVNTHYVYYTESPNIAPSQASIASFCLDQCIAYQANATGNVPCLGFSVDMGTVYTPNPNDTAIRWFCTAFDALLSPELYQLLEPDVYSYMYLIGVNRVCEGTFRAY
jgi:hypothetical protein